MAQTEPTGALAGRRILVTGASKRIGRGIALRLAREGARVAIHYHGSEKEARATAAECGNAPVFKANLEHVAEIERLFADVDTHFGRIDALVNNAAVRMEAPFEQITLEDWRRVIASILDAAFVCTQACLPHLIKSGGGTVINIGGLTGHRGATGRAHVIAAKAGLAGMTKALALDLAPHHITVNCVVPGTIESQRGLPGVPERPAHRAAPPPIGRRGEPEEVAAMVRMLCGPDARYITGQAIHVNGGGYMP